MVRLTYSADWSEVYSRRKFILCDPTVVWCLMNEGTTRWSDITLGDPLGVMAEASRHGYGFGVSIGLGGIESKTIGSCGRGDRDFSDTEISMISQSVNAIHTLLGGTSRLKKHHLDALRTIEEGLTYEQSCERLNLSRTAFGARLSIARRELDAKSNADAVRIAVERGLLSSTSYTGVSTALPKNS
jgi:LuxR family transcriptional regulator